MGLVPGDVSGEDSAFVCPGMVSRFSDGVASTGFAEN